VARLHNTRVEIEIVRHDGGAKDPDGDVKHFAVFQNFDTRNEAHSGFFPEGLCEEDFVSKARADCRDESDDKDLNEAETTPLQEENDEHVEGGDEDAGEERQSEKQLKGDGRAKDFGKIASGDGNFANKPERVGDRPGVMVTTGLSEVAAGDDAEFCRQRLQEHRHEVAKKDDAKQGVAKLGASAEVGGPITR